jgi:hypothetical protein
MITSRFLQPEDYELLATSIAGDEYHSDLSPVFFVEPETITLVYEDERGVVLFIRGKGIVENGQQNLWISVQYVSNTDGKRNIRTMLAGFPSLVEKAKANGFVEIRFNSVAPLLRKFATTRLGFTEDGEEMLRHKIQ